MPFSDGELDRWNQEQVEACSHMSLAEVLHEFGVAWGTLVAQMRRITPAQWESDRQTLRAWRKAQ